MTGPDYVGIGAVVERLSEEFPDITVSKVRYLETEGLIDPMRTARGSRRYSASDLDRLRRVLRMQRDEYLPLRVIRDQLDRPDETVNEPGVATTRLRRRRSQVLSRTELCERSGIAPATLAELERYGLVVHHDTEALAVCTIVARLQEFGIEPRHLRAFRVAADREIGLVEQALAPHRVHGARTPAEGSGKSLRSGDASAAPRPTARQAREQLLGLCVDLHTALVRQGMTD